MRKTGPTQGGFDGHFQSKDGLIAATLAGLVVAMEPGPTALSGDAADPEAGRQAAIGSWAAMVGAMIFARMNDGPDLSDEVTAQAGACIARALPAGAAG